ncbi:MAG: TolC family protein, partial [Pseudomonadota bacterium]
MVRLHLYILALVFSVVLAGCHSAPPRPELTAATPAEWVRAEQVNTDADDAWLETLGSDALSARVSDAVDQNYALGAARARLDQARQSAVIARAPRLPSISLSLDRNRRRIVRNFTGDALDDGVVNQVASANLDLQWQIDIWGELAASARSAAYNYAAAEATYI